MYPGKFEDLIEAFRHLPGVGIKTAERYAFTALEWDEETFMMHSSVRWMPSHWRNQKVHVSAEI